MTHPTDQAGSKSLLLLAEYVEAFQELDEAFEHSRSLEFRCNAKRVALEGLDPLALRAQATAEVELRARVERLTNALEWYAEQVAGCRKIGSIGDPARHALDKDGGERARAALAPRSEAAAQAQVDL